MLFFWGEITETVDFGCSDRYTLHGIGCSGIDGIDGRILVLYVHRNVDIAILCVDGFSDRGYVFGQTCNVHELFSVGIEDCKFCGHRIFFSERAVVHDHEEAIASGRPAAHERPAA